MARRKFFLEYNKHNSNRPYAVLPEHMIVHQLTENGKHVIYMEGQWTAEEHTQVRSKVIKLVPAWIWGDGEWIAEFRPGAVKRDELTDREIWGERSHRTHYWTHDPEMINVNSKKHEIREWVMVLNEGP